MNASRRARIQRLAGLAAAIAAIAGMGSAPASADAAMVSTRLGPSLCVTTGGAKIVRIPGFPGERIDRRLLRDVSYLRRRYDIHITDGYSNDPVHSANGEHPLGLALDIVPEYGAGWGLVSALARWAEPKQDSPRQPFRWVGYNGDANHGKGHHLHLSWAHSEPRPGKLPRTVYTIKCPTSGGDGSGGGSGDGSGPAGGTDGGGGNTGGGDGSTDDAPTNGDGGLGGAPAGTDGGTSSGSRDPSTSGGIGLKPAPVAPERGGAES